MFQKANVTFFLIVSFSVYADADENLHRHLCRWFGWWFIHIIVNFVLIYTFNDGC